MPGFEEQNQPLITRDKSWRTLIKENKSLLAAIWIPQLIINSLLNVICVSGSSEACHKGMNDGQNRTDYSNKTSLLQMGGGIFSMYLMPPVVICANLLAYDGGKLIGNSVCWTDTFKGVVKLGASSLLVIGAAGFEFFVAEPLLQKGTLGDAYDAGYNYNGYTAPPCDRFEFPVAVTTGLDVITGALAAGTALGAARYGLFLGKKEREEKHTLSVMHVQASL